jgi:hypothetical protein
VIRFRRCNVSGTIGLLNTRKVDQHRHMYGRWHLLRFVVAASLGCVFIFGQPPSTPSTSAPNNSAKSNPKKQDPFLGARVAYAEYLTTYFAKIGYQTIKATAIGTDQRTLELSSPLIGKPFGKDSANLIAAREVIESDESLAVIKRARFREVVLRGSSYTEEHNVAR